MADRYSERGAQRWEDERQHWDERGFFDRLRDELRSWFGDEEAQRRRIRDEREDYRGERRDWSGRSPSEWSREPDQRDWGRQWGYTERGAGGGWGDRGREWNSGWGGGGFGARGYGSGYSAPRERDRRREPEWGRQGGDDGVYRGTVSEQRESGGAWRADQDWGRYSGASEYGGGREQWMSGAHAGRGPRNYQRPDERIRDEVCERLAHHPHLDASEIDVRVEKGDVTLQGSVNDRWAKRWAEDVAEGIWGVKDVHNQIRVTTTAFGQEGREGQEGQQRPGQQQRGPWAA